MQPEELYPPVGITDSIIKKYLPQLTPIIKELITWLRNLYEMILYNHLYTVRPDIFHTIDGTNSYER